MVLRRRPVRMVDGRAEGGYTGEFEIVCRDCGDDPDLDYREVAPALRQIRGPYPMAAGVTAYVRHAQRHPGPVNGHQPGSRPSRESTRWEQRMTYRESTFINGKLIERPGENAEPKAA